MAKALKNKQQKSGKRSGSAKPDARKASAKAAASRTEKRALTRADRGRTAAKTSRPAERRGLRRFIHDVRVEMSKVTWPTRQDLLQSTLVVVVAVVIAGVTIAAYDFVFSRLIDLVIPK